MSDEAKAIVERVTVISPKPGDVVVFQLRENAGIDAIEEFVRTLANSLPPSFDSVQVVGARCFEGVKVMRAGGDDAPE